MEQRVQLRLFFQLFIFLFSLPALAQDHEKEIHWFQTFVKDNQRVSSDRLLARTQASLDSTLEMNDHRKRAKKLSELGMIHFTRTFDYERAIDYFIQSLVISDSLDYEAEKIFCYILIADVFVEVGNALKAEELLEDAQMYNRQLEDKHIAAIILNKLGLVNAAQEKREHADKSYKEALLLLKDIEDRVLKADAEFNLANLETQQGNLEAALERHKRALSIIRSFRDRHREATSLNDIGELYLLMNNLERAFANHQAALEIRTELKDQKGVAASYNNLGVLYYRQKNYPEAMKHLSRGLSAARETNTHDQIRKAHEYLALCYEGLGEFEKALDHKDEYISISDFMQREQNERQLLEAQSRYVIEGKQSRIRSLESIKAQRENELREQKRFRDFLFAVIGLGTVIVFLVIYLYFTIRRSNKKLKVAHTRVQEQNIQLQDLNATKDKFFSIISHDLKGPLNSLTSFSGLLINHTDSLSKDEIRMLAKDLDKSLKNLFALLENLLEWSRSQTGNIDFKSEPFSLNDMLEQNKTLLQAQAQNKNIEIEVQQLPPLTINAHKHSVNTVIRNLVSNAIKFTPSGGRIRLGVKSANGELIVSIADTGVGMPAEVLKKLFRIDTKHSTKGTADEKGTGLGLILCKEFIERNGGRIWVESTEGKGSVFSFALPWSQTATVPREKPVIAQ